MTDDFLARPHPWQSAADEWQDKTLPELMRRGLAIGRAARAGNEDALEVMRLYEMLYRSFDPMTYTVLVKAMARCPND